jgi:hypothetical protein
MRIVLAIALCACGAAKKSATFPAAALATVSSADLSVALRTGPEQPPVRGGVDAELTLTDASGAPEDGLTLSVTPWMPEMGHGASVVPAVAAEGDGKYLVTNLDLFMPGTWELRVSAGSDNLVLNFDVQ